MVLLDWKLESEKEAASEDSTPSLGLELVFRSHVTGRHYHTAPIHQDYIRPAGCCLVECPKCGAGVGMWCEQDCPTPNGKRLLLHEERREAAGKYDGIGWHTFRHRYRSWLDDTGAPMGGTAKADATRPNLDHDERVRQRADGSQAGSQHQSRQEGLRSA
jgi:integrase